MLKCFSFIFFKASSLYGTFLRFILIYFNFLLQHYETKFLLKQAIMLFDQGCPHLYKWTEANLTSYKIKHYTSSKTKSKITFYYFFFIFLLMFKKIMKKGKRPCAKVWEPCQFLTPPEATITAWKCFWSQLRVFKFSLLESFHILPGRTPQKYSSASLHVHNLSISQQYWSLGTVVAIPKPFLVVLHGWSWGKLWIIVLLEYPSTIKIQCLDHCRAAWWSVIQSVLMHLLGYEQDTMSVYVILQLS